MKRLAAVPSNDRGIDMEAPILGVDGEALKDGERKVVLRDLCINALLAPDKEATEIQKLDCFMLAILLKKKRHPKLRAEDIALLKKKIGAAYPPLLMGRAFELLDPASIKEPWEE